MKVVNFNRRVVSVAGTSVTSARIFSTSAGISRTFTLPTGSWRVLGRKDPGIPCPAPVVIVHGASIECTDRVLIVTLDGIHGRDDVLASPASVKVMHVHVQGRPFDVQGITPRLQVVQRDVQVSTSSVLALPLDVQGGPAAAIARTAGVLARTDDVRALRARFTKTTARFTTRSVAFTKIPGDIPVCALDAGAVMALASLLEESLIAERPRALDRQGSSQSRPRALSGGGRRPVDDRDGARDRVSHPRTSDAPSLGCRARPSPEGPRYRE